MVAADINQVMEKSRNKFLPLMIRSGVKTGVKIRLLSTPEFES